MDRQSATQLLKAYIFCCEQATFEEHQPVSFQLFSEEILLFLSFWLQLPPVERREAPDASAAKMVVKP
jgi:hypothetical protein